MGIDGVLSEWKSSQNNRWNKTKWRWWLHQNKCEILPNSCCYSKLLKRAFILSSHLLYFGCFLAKRKNRAQVKKSLIYFSFWILHHVIQCLCSVVVFHSHYHVKHFPHHFIQEFVIKIFFFLHFFTTILPNAIMLFPLSFYMQKNKISVNLQQGGFISGVFLYIVVVVAAVCFMMQKIFLGSWSAFSILKD